MPKRSFEEKMEYYEKKMEKLKQKQQCKRRRLDYSSSSDQNEPISKSKGDSSATFNVTESHPESVNMEPMYDSDETGQNAGLPVQDDAYSQPTTAVSLNPTEPTVAADPLDPEILSALGEATDQGPSWGPEIHNNLSSLWQPLLKKGLDKEAREKLTKAYLIPSNCSLLQAPKLNIEISAAVTEMVRIRDKKVENIQQQLGIGVTAISRAMTQLLTTDNKIEAIKIMSDGCRIFCDLHNMQTKSRIKMITPGLAKPFLNVIQDSERDDTLFGANLQEKIKASKTIEKQGLQIKKGASQPKSTLVQHNVAPRQYQGNWSGPLRYPTSRGGRGGPRRFTTSIRRPTASTSTTTQPRASQGQTRARTQQ